MKLRPYVIQEHREDGSANHLFTVTRVNYAELLDSLKYPLLWSYDHYLQSWIPGEIDHEFARWLRSTESGSEIEDPLRIPQLLASGVGEHDGRRWWEDLRDSLQADGFVKIPKLFATEYSKQYLTPYYYRNSRLHQRHRDMKGISRSSANNTPLMRLLHQATERMINFVVSENVKTSYSFSSSYDSSSVLPAHVDRKQCVYNISLLLGSSPTQATLGDWPLYIKHKGKTTPVGLEAGDAVLYSGVRDLHWRDAMPSHLESVFGVFFHYVPAEFDGSLD